MEGVVIMDYGMNVILFEKDRTVSWCRLKSGHGR